MNRLTKILALLCLVACTKQPDAANNGSETSDIVLNLPAENRYGAYKVTIKRYGKFAFDLRCSNDQSFPGTKPANNSVPISKVVKNGCDYIIVVDLGDRLDPSGKELVEVTYSNKTESKDGDVVLSSRLIGGKVVVDIEVFKVVPKPGQPGDGPPSASGDGITANATDVVPLDPPQDKGPVVPLDASAAARDGFANVKQIFEAHCYECHMGKYKDIDLTAFPFQARGFNSQKELVETMLVVTQSTKDVAPAMPPQPRDPLNDEELNKLKTWLQSF